MKPGTIFTEATHPRRRSCMLIVTHACNLNCSYCYERYRGPRRMTFETAKACIGRELELVRNSERYDELEIQFFGGEPFMNFAVIRQTVEWLERERPDVPLVCFASSNGTLITGEIREWLTRHRRRMWVGLSYDGIGEMQTANRGAAAIADVDWFIRTWPAQGLHMTVSKETLPNLADGVMAIQRKGGRCTVALAQGVAWDDEDAALYRRELRKLADFYLAHAEYPPVEPLMNRSLGGIGQPAAAKRFCGSGGAMVTYDVDGMTYPCHLFSPLVLGADALSTDVAEVCRCGCLADESCRGCSFVNYCPTCYGFNHRLRGDVRRRDHSCCKMVRAQAEVVSEFQLRYYHQRKDAVTEADAAQLAAALRVHGLFANNGITIPEERR